MSTPEFKAGDYVRTNYRHPLAPKYYFYIESFETRNNELYAVGKHGKFPVSALIKTFDPESKTKK